MVAGDVVAMLSGNLVDEALKLGRFQLYQLPTARAL